MEQSKLITLPSIVSPEVSPKVSGKYGFVNTAEVVAKLETMGFVVRTATQQGRGSSARHVVKMVESGSSPQFDGTRPELIIMNAHNGTSSLRFLMGLYRMVCSNGLIVSDGVDERIVLRHSQGLPQNLESIIELVKNKATGVFEHVKSMNEAQVNSDALFAYTGAVLSQVKIEPSATNIQLALSPRRTEDQSNDAWHVLNRVQENLIKGGLKFEGRRRATKEIKGILGDFMVNKAVWDNKALLVG